MRVRSDDERFWETETWSAVDNDDDGDDCGISDGKGDWITEDGLDIADARVMAVAPEMIRLLLEVGCVTWAGSDGNYGGCPFCDEPGDRRDPPAHKPDCRWVATLRKAGVLAS